MMMMMMITKSSKVIDAFFHLQPSSQFLFTKSILILTCHPFFIAQDDSEGTVLLKFYDYFEYPFASYAPTHIIFIS